MRGRRGTGKTRYAKGNSKGAKCPGNNTIGVYEASRLQKSGTLGTSRGAIVKTELINKWLAARDARDAAWAAYDAALESQGFTPQVWELRTTYYELKGRAAALAELVLEQSRDNVTDSEVPAGRESVTPVPAPVYHAQYTTWNRRRHVKGYRARIIAEIAGIVDVAFKINEERAASWREQIVDEEIAKDGAA